MPVMQIVDGRNALTPSSFAKMSPPARPSRQAEAPIQPQGDSFQSTDAIFAEAQDRQREDGAMRRLALTLGSAVSLVGAFSGQHASAASSSAAPAAIEIVSSQNLEVGTQSLARSEKIAPGTLILSDFFDQRTGPAHGGIVENSSREVGFDSTIVRHEAPENAANKAASRFFSRLDNQQFTPEQLKDFTSNYITNRQSGNLQSATDELTRLTEMDVRGSVLNLSRGSGKAQIMEDIYDRLRLGWDQTAHPQSITVGERRVRKMAPALGLDADAVLQDKDGARGELQKRLLGLIDTATADDKVAQAQSSYDRAVAEFEAKGNSVVVAAANSGKVLRTMERDASGIDVAPDFFRNLLGNDQVTTVGSTRIQGGEKTIADYTNADPGIDVYANGRYGEVEGTSYATPRVASVMAELHRQNPNASSSDVEAMMKQRFGQTLGDYGHWVKAPVLNEIAAKQWLGGSGNPTH